ncbi:MAG: cell division protein FtsW [Cytophagales bacterium]|nr:MAG: cell division protein FtsW [Cytophagales bacterium]TAF60165.1 MAG: cell division protein FtsW [Cytophagales bacterium]
MSESAPLSSPKSDWYLSKYLKGDPVIWIVVLLLALISILVVYSATGTLAFKRADQNMEYYLFKHSVLMVFCFATIWLCHNIDYRYYSRLSRFALLASVPLLLITLKFGTTINEATRWLTIPFINQTFQPSDLAGFALIANTASMLSKRQRNIKEFQRAIMPVLFWCGLICCLISLSDFSGGALLFINCMVVMFIGRVPVRYLLILALVGALAGFIAFKLGERGGTVRNRTAAYLSEDVPFQAQQAFVAIAIGGLSGKGPGNSTQRSILPYPFSDFVFAILVEEYGMLGGLLVVVLYLILLFRGMKAMAHSDTAFGGLLSAGLAFYLVMQAMVHIGVTVGLLPITGLPLPILSMGGTSLLFTGMTIGVILSVSRGVRPNANIAA